MEPASIQDVLVVEDDPADVQLLELAFQCCSAPPRTVVANDGASALRVLRAGDYRPTWVLLDLNLPGLNGKELLSAVRKEAGFEELGIVVFSSSSSVHDATECYALGANCYIEKPDDMATLVTTLESLVRFWARVVAAGHCV